MKNKNLVAARKRTDMTQKEVAARLGIAESAYRRYELGGAIPSVVTGNVIAKVLNSTSEHLWGYGSTKGL